MPEPPEQARQRMRARRLAERRRQAVAQLRVGAAACSYAARQLGDGLSPCEAQMAALVIAAELENVAGALRRLAAMPPAQRRPVTAGLVADGMSQAQAAHLLGVSTTCVQKDLRA